MNSVPGGAATVEVADQTSAIPNRTVTSMFPSHKKLIFGGAAAGVCAVVAVAIAMNAAPANRQASHEPGKPEIQVAALEPGDDDSGTPDPETGIAVKTI